MQNALGQRRNEPCRVALTESRDSCRSNRAILQSQAFAEMRPVRVESEFYQGHQCKDSFKADPVGVDPDRN